MAKVIMIQGTMSNAGKSFLTAALCRIFRQDGHRVAPFKSQNMALNSYITEDGLEIGRAQALQAEAAGITPSALMNPVLLKPTTDVGSQVIVNGIARGNMRAADYFRRKTELIPDILHAFNTLSHQFDVIVIEGAGSPVELNLKENDIVNMGLAKLLHAPVLLAGDIDRGGIFAQLLGTLDLLDPDERTLVKGLIVNQFRGDISIFQDGVSILEARSGIPVLGVVPHIECDLEDEDSLSEKLKRHTADTTLDLAVIRLPKISNFTDFDVFSQYPGASVRYVSKPEQLGMPDLIFLPGSKSTITDMEWIRKTGLEDAIRKCFANEIPVFGICGGFQMLGAEICDPEGYETGGSIGGIGLLPCRTVFTEQKTQMQTKGRFAGIKNGFFSCLSGKPFYGYEVHMGQTSHDGFQLTDRGGCVNGNAAGCYVHGIFDSAEVSGALIAALAAKKRITLSAPAIDRNVYREQQINLMADAVRKHLNMDAIYQIMENQI